MVNITYPSRYKIGKKSLIPFCEDLMVKKGVDPKANLNITFVGRRKMREIASTYKHEDVALPVLAFGYHEEQANGEFLLGEIVMCYPQVVLLAAERSKTVEVMMQQLIDHGLKNILTK